MAKRKAKYKKATNSEVNKRVTQVVKMLTMGVSRADILQYAADKWQIAERTTDDYIRRANKHFAETSVYNRDEQIGLAMARLNTLYQKTMQIDDYKAALAAQKELSNMLGLHAPRRSDVAMTNTNINIPAEDAHEASNILNQLAELGAIPPTTSATDNDTETE